MQVIWTSTLLKILLNWTSSSFLRPRELKELFTVRPFSKIDAAFFHFSFLIISIFRFWNKSSSNLKGNMSGANKPASYWLDLSSFKYLFSLYRFTHLSSHSSMIQGKNMIIFFYSWFVFVTNELGMKVLVWFTKYRSFKTSFE